MKHVNGRMCEAVLRAAKRTDADAVVELDVHEFEAGTDSAREHEYWFSVYVRENGSRREVFWRTRDSTDNTLAAFLRWLDT